MKSAKYFNILQDFLQSSVQKSELGADWMFQQDKEPKQTAKVARAWFKNNNIWIMKCLRLSPETNQRQNLWKLLMKRIRERRPKDLSEMKLFAKEEWEKIQFKTSQASVEKCRNGQLALFDNELGPTK